MGRADDQALIPSHAQATHDIRVALGRLRLPEVHIVASCPAKFGLRRSRNLPALLRWSTRRQRLPAVTLNDDKCPWDSELRWKTLEILEEPSPSALTRAV